MKVLRPRRDILPSFAISLTLLAAPVIGAHQSGMGHTLPGTANTGFFWFFGAENLELAVRVLDCTAVNDHHWLFCGA